LCPAEISDLRVHLTGIFLKYEGDGNLRAR
jgi:hypothetical protein